MSYASPTVTVTYAYDAAERRIAKTVNGVTEAFILDQMGEPNTLEPSNIVLSFEGGALAARWVYSDRVDEPLGFERYVASTVPAAGESFTLYADREGWVTDVVADATGTLTAAYSYSAYGTRSETGTLEQPYGYRGRELDTESGLYHLRWRAYDPVTGLFLQMDPLGFGGGQENLYAYVDNNPFMASDPMGLTAFFAQSAMVDGRMQTLGSATRNVSSGVFSTVAGMIEAMQGDWRRFAGSVKTVPALGPATGNTCHGSTGENEEGQHIYVRNV